MRAIRDDDLAAVGASVLVRSGVHARTVAAREPNERLIGDPDAPNLRGSMSPRSKKTGAANQRPVSELCTGSWASQFRSMWASDVPDHNTERDTLCRLVPLGLPTASERDDNTRFRAPDGSRSVPQRPNMG
jgi:hypothetical protein